MVTVNRVSFLLWSENRGTEDISQEPTVRRRAQRPTRDGLWVKQCQDSEKRLWQPGGWGRGQGQGVTSSRCQGYSETGSRTEKGRVGATEWRLSWAKHRILSTRRPRRGEGLGRRDPLRWQLLASISMRRSSWGWILCISWCSVLLRFQVY